jgi:hypothetical protein
MHLTASDYKIHDSGASSVLFSHESRMLKKYVDRLARCQKPEVLDLGPVCGNNISFFLNRIAKLHVCDVFSHLPQEKKNDPDAEKYVSLLDYKKHSFDGINLWDVPDHLGNRTLALLIPHLQSLLKPSGMLMMIASTTSEPQPYPLFFVIRNDCAVILQTKTEHRLSYYYRANRDIERSMKPFRQKHSFICTNGIREFLYKP